jgi:hypothetical protein
MVVYGMRLNRVLVFLANGFLLFALVFGFYRKRIRLGQVLLGLLTFVVTLGVLFFLTSWTLGWIRSAYPLYENYYPNAYNSGYFYIALAAEGVCVFSLLYLWPLRKWSVPSLFISVLLLETILLDFLYPYIPGGVYFFYFPLIFAGALFPSLSKSWSNLLSLLPAIFLMVPLYTGLVSLLDVEKEAAITAPVLGLFLGLAIPIISRCPRWFLPGASFLVFMAFMGWGLLHGGYDAKHPYKTDLRYYVDADNRSGWLVTHETKLDNWNRQFFRKYFWDTSTYQYPETFFAQPKEYMMPAEFIDLEGPRLLLQKDTLVNGRRKLYLHCQVPKGTVTIHLSFEPNVALFDYPGERSWMDYIQPPGEGFDLQLESEGPVRIRVISRTMGIPPVNDFKGYPEGVIPTPSGYANTTMVGRRYSF